MFKKGNNVKKICIAIITAVLVLGSYNVVHALTRSELEQKRVELKTKIEEAGKNIENIQVQLTENLEAINSLDEEIYQYETQIKQISQNLTQVETQIKQTEEILTTLQTTYEYQKRLIRKTIAICI